MLTVVSLLSPNVVGNCSEDAESRYTFVFDVGNLQQQPGLLLKFLICSDLERRAPKVAKA